MIYSTRTFFLDSNKNVIQVVLPGKWVTGICLLPRSEGLGEDYSLWDLVSNLPPQSLAILLSFRILTLMHWRSPLSMTTGLLRAQH